MNKTPLKFALGVLMFCMLLIPGCKDDKEDTPPSNNNATEKEDQFSAQIGLVRWVAATCGLQVSGGVLSLSATNNNQSITINAIVNGPGSYQIEGNSPDNSAIYVNGSGEQFSTLVGGSATLILSEYTNDQLTGTFVMNDLESTGGNTITITDGMVSIRRTLAFEVYFPTGPDPIALRQGQSFSIGSGEVRLLGGPTEKVTLSFDQISPEINVFSNLTEGTPPFTFEIFVEARPETPIGSYPFKIIGETAGGIRETKDIDLVVTLHPTNPLQGTYSVTNSNNTAPASLGLPTSYTDEVRINTDGGPNRLTLQNFLDIQGVNIIANVTEGSGGQGNTLSIDDQNLPNGHQLLNFTEGAITVVGNGDSGTTFNVHYTYRENGSDHVGIATYIKQ